MEDHFATFQWYDFLRIATSVFAFLSLYISGKRARENWSDYTNRLKGLVWLVHGLLFLLGEGTIEQIVLDIPWGPRTLLSFILSLGGLLVISKKEGFLKSEKE